MQSDMNCEGMKVYIKQLWFVSEVELPEKDTK